MEQRTLLASAAAVLGLLALVGCDDRLAMQPAREHATEFAATTAPAPVASPAMERSERAASADRPARAERVSAPVRLVSGKPAWADNRQHTAEENIRYQFEQHGRELGARNVDDFVARAHRFVNTPPDGALTLTRANGDRLLFDERSGLFGVVRSDGAPRTVFKPETGKAYWDEQVASQGQRATTRRATRNDRSDRG